jgi:hypothetical protein
MTRLKLLAAALLAGLALAGCSMLTPQTSSFAGPVAVVQADGGHCLEGSCKIVTTIARDATVTIDPAVGETVTLHVDAALVTALAAAVDATDFAVITGVPFTGECPTAFDGQELTYTFSPVGRQPVTFSSCQVEIPVEHPLFRALDAVMLAATPQ